MKIRKQILIAVVAIPLLYGGTYCVLRLTKYFVRQEFLSLSCSESTARRMKSKYQDDVGKLRDGYTGYSYESDRNRIGCGRIQKGKTRFGEAILQPLFLPLGELEMYIRGFGKSTMQVYKNVQEFERYDSESNKVYYTRTTLMEEFSIARRDQTF